MNTFNINRFWNTLVRLFITRKKELRNIFFTYSILFFVLSVCATGIFNTDPLTDVEALDSLLGVTPMYMIIYFGGAVLMGAFVIKDLEYRGARIHELALPATNLEKYAARVIYSSLGILITASCGVLLADGLQQLMSMLMHHGGRASIIGLAFMSPAFSEVPTSKLIAAILGLVLNNASFILGGMFFRKVAWLKTSIALWVLAMIGSMGVALFASILFFYTDYELYIDQDMQITSYIIGYSLVGIALFYFLGYRLYCRLQAINNRWINI